MYELEPEWETFPPPPEVELECEKLPPAAPSAEEDVECDALPQPPELELGLRGTRGLIQAQARI